MLFIINPTLREIYVFFSGSGESAIFLDSFDSTRFGPPGGVNAGIKAVTGCRGVAHLHTGFGKVRMSE